MIAIIIVLSVIIIVISYASFNLFRKYESLEDEYDAFFEDSESFRNDIRNRVTYVNKTLKVIDAKGTFESDDEVGFFFKELKLLNDLLSEDIE